jgi:hypothetical protein
VFVTTTRTNLSDSEKWGSERTRNGARKLHGSPVHPKHVLVYFFERLKLIHLLTFGYGSFVAGIRCCCQMQENSASASMAYKSPRLSVSPDCRPLPNCLMPPSGFRTARASNSSASDGPVDAVGFSSSLKSLHYYCNTNPYIKLRSTHLS